MFPVNNIFCKQDIFGTSVSKEVKKVLEAGRMILESLILKHKKRGTGDFYSETNL